MPRVGFEITVPASERLQTHTLDRVANEKTFDHGEKKGDTIAVHA